ncbi:class A sortase [Enterococcus sp.]|uniref:class A sortase n=1 Tax=Enterococcus sp. TaxID=35783 RepID=UPI0029113A16|nr:class A sortase [Enterococcus sp.]MDU5333957.1 class A sortase [Enterococcus sp.]
MTKKIRLSLILIYCVAISLLFLPFLKQAAIIYQTQTVSIKPSELIRTSSEVPLEAVQPPDLSEVLAFDRNRTFRSTGQIVIPKVEISLPLFSGITNDQLLVGAGTLFPERTAENQNIVVLGHHLGRENLLFGKLLNITIGDSIYLEYQNQFYQYKVSQTMTIQQTELQVLANSKQAELTLITCDKPTHTEQRFVVKGKLVNQPVKTTKQTIMQQKSQIKEKNSQKNRKYCRMILILFLASLVIGTGIIIRISRK